MFLPLSLLRKWHFPSMTSSCDLRACLPYLIYSPLVWNFWDGGRSFGSGSKARLKVWVLCSAAAWLRGVGISWALMSSSLNGRNWTRSMILMRWGSMSSLCVYQDLECGEHVLFDNVQNCVYLENGKKMFKVAPYKSLIQPCWLT